MNVTINQARLGLAVILLTLLVIAIALLFWQHSLHIQASLIGGLIRPFGRVPEGC